MVFERSITFDVILCNNGNNNVISLWMDNTIN